VATTIYDLMTQAVVPNGQLNGWGQALDTGPVSTIVPVSPTPVLTPNMIVTKHTAIDSGQDPNRADLDYGGGNTPSPAGLPKINPSDPGRWLRFWVMFDNNYRSTTDGSRPRFNLFFDIHGNVTVYTPIMLEVNHATQMISLEINGGGTTTTPTRSLYWDLFPLALNSIYEFTMYVDTATNSSGRVILKARKDGVQQTAPVLLNGVTPVNPVTTTVDGVQVSNVLIDDNGANMCTTETGCRMQVKHYRAGNHSFPTTSIYHTGVIMGDVEADLNLPVQAQNIKQGYQVQGGTSNTNTAGQRGSAVTISQKFLATHIVCYLDFLASAGAVEFAFQGNVGGVDATGAKLLQTRQECVDGTSPDGWYALPLVNPQVIDPAVTPTLTLTAMFQTGAAKVNWVGDAVGTNLFHSDSAVWSIFGGADPLSANATGNKLRQMSIYLAGVDVTPPATPTPTTIPGASTVTMNPVLKEFYPRENRGSHHKNRTGSGGVSTKALEQKLSDY
jgi:hypothetical protein